MASAVSFLLLILFTSLVPIFANFAETTVMAARVKDGDTNAPFAIDEDVEVIRSSYDITTPIWSKPFPLRNGRLDLTLTAGLHDPPVIVMDLVDPITDPVQIELFATIGLPTYLDDKCKTAPTSIGNNARLLDYDFLEVCWINGATTDCEVTRRMRYTFEDENNHQPEFSSSSLNLAVSSDREISIPLNNDVPLQVRDKDYSLNIITLRVLGEGAEGFAANSTQTLPADECPTHWTHNVHIYATEPLSHEIDKYTLTLEVSDGGTPAVVIPLEITVTLKPPTTKRPILPEDTVCNATDEYGTRWIAHEGNLAVMPCPSEEAGNATWFCSINAQFIGESPDFSKCSSVWVSEILDRITNGTNFQPEESLTLITNISKLLGDGREQGGEGGKGNKIYGHEIVSILTSVIDLLEKTELTEYSDAYNISTSSLGVVDNILLNEASWGQINQTERDTGVTRVIDLLESSSLSVASIMLEGDETVETRSESGTIVTAAGRVGTNTEINFPQDSNHVQGKDTFISLPGLKDGTTVFTASSVKASEVQKLVNTIVRGHPASEDLVVNGDLMTISIFNNATSGKLKSAVRANISTPVELTYRHDRESWGSKKRTLRRRLHPGERPKAVEGASICSYWNKDLLAWSTDGCEMVTSSQFSTTCRCNHLTSFNLIAQVHEYKSKSTFFLVAIVASIIILAAYNAYTIILKYYETAKRVRTEFQATLKAGVGVAVIQRVAQFGLTISYAVIYFLVDKDFLYLSDTTCYLSGVVTHLLLLSLFSFLALESLLKIHYGYFEEKETRAEQISQEDENRTFIEKGLAPCLNFLKKFPTTVHVAGPVCMAIVIVVITVVVDAARGPNSRAYGGDFCWLERSYVWAFNAPIFVIVLATLIICILEYRWITGRQGNRSTETMNLLQQTFLMHIAIGISWIFGLFQLGPYYVEGEWFSIAFIILGVIQGHILNKYAPEEDQDEVAEGQEEDLEQPKTERVFIERVPIATNYLFGKNNKVSSSENKKGRIGSDGNSTSGVTNTGDNNKIDCASNESHNNGNLDGLPLKESLEGLGTEMRGFLPRGDEKLSEC